MSGTPVLLSAFRALQDGRQQQQEERDYEAHAPPGEGANDDLVAGAFAARERNRVGDFDFAEHPLEKRANEARENDCKVGGGGGQS